MTDRELLELAAKAIHFKWDEQAFDGTLMAGNARWNPLTDDGDALRLAVKLRMVLDTSTGDGIHVQYPFGTGYYPLCEEGDPDPYATTRRAIVRAAAKIGRNQS
jgi:hypothetical protein